MLSSVGFTPSGGQQGEPHFPLSSLQCFSFCRAWSDLGHTELVCPTLTRLWYCTMKETSCSLCLVQMLCPNPPDCVTQAQKTSGPEEAMLNRPKASQRCWYWN